MEPTDAEEKEEARLHAAIIKRKRDIVKLQGQIQKDQDAIKESEHKVCQLPSRVNKRRAVALFDLVDLGKKFLLSWTKRRYMSQLHEGGQELNRALAQRANPEIGIQSTGEHNINYRAMIQWQTEETLLMNHSFLLDCLRPHLLHLAESVLFFLLPRGAVLEFQFLTRLVDRVRSRLVSATPNSFTFRSPSVSYRYELDPKCTFKTEDERSFFINIEESNRLMEVFLYDENETKQAIIRVERPRNEPSEWCADSLQLRSAGVYRSEFEAEASHKLHLSLLPTHSKTTEFKTNEEEKQASLEEIAKRWKCYEDVRTSFAWFTNDTGFADPFNLRAMAQHPHLDAVIFILMTRRWKHDFECPAFSEPSLFDRLHTLEDAKTY